MKIISKIGFGLVTATLLFVGCGESPVTPTASSGSDNYNGIQLISASSLGYRKDSVFDEKNEANAPAVQYSKAAPGTSTKIQRAFQDAPPMIPHDTTGMLIITKGNNQCLQCHSPEMAAMVGATPIPKSHFFNMRPGNKIVKGKLVKGLDNLQNQISIKHTTKFYAGRYNCVQCHAPQSNAKLITPNRFKSEYLSDDGAFKSHWADVAAEKLDTVGKDSGVTPADIANKNSEAGTPVVGKH